MHEIVLSSLSLTEIPRSTFQNPSALTISIKLDNNLLTSLPNELLSLSFLRYINLRGNNLSIFPVVLAQLYHLKILDVSRNCIAMLPEDPGWYLLGIDFR
jgi:Leucine-rich repeat (LRR) protein